MKFLKTLTNWKNNIDAFLTSKKWDADIPRLKNNTIQPEHLIKPDRLDLFFNTAKRPENLPKAAKLRNVYLKMQKDSKQPGFNRHTALNNSGLDKEHQTHLYNFIQSNHKDFARKYAQDKKTSINQELPEAIPA